MLECFRHNFEMFRILLYNVYVLKCRGCHFVKTKLMAFIHINPLNFMPSHLQKEKTMPEYSE